MQNTIQKTAALRFWSGILSVSTDDGATYTNLWGLKDAKVTVKKKIKEMVLDNARMPPKIKIEEIKLSATLYEIVLANLNSIDGFADYSSVTGSATPVTAEAKGTGWTIGKPIRLNYKNGANTQVASIVVKAGGSALTVSTNYVIYVGDGTNGDLGYTYVVPVTASALAITVDYSYTPYQRNEQLFKDVEKYLSTNRFKFVNLDANGKEFGIEFYKGYNVGDTEFAFKSDDDTDAMGLWIEIKAFPNSSNAFMRIWDEQNVL